MKKIIFMVIASILCFEGMAMAGEADYMISRMWERQEIGVQGLLQCFKRDCPPAEYKEPALQIISAEINLMAYGISPKNQRLISNLASDVKSTSDYPVFAYRVFKKKLRELTGFSLSPEGAFAGNRLRVIPREGNSARPIIINLQ
jgi:hypothetical protein